jgi:DNA-binding beta-propeller fold protein YncE
LVVVFAFVIIIAYQNQLNSQPQKASEPKIFDIKVGHQPSVIAVDPSTNKVYVANTGPTLAEQQRGLSSVSFINGSNKPLEINLGKRVADDIAVNSNTKKVYILDISNATVSVLNGKTDKDIKNT